jgi:hypothetical protein
MSEDKVTFMHADSPRKQLWELENTFSFQPISRELLNDAKREREYIKEDVIEDSIINKDRAECFMFLERVIGECETYFITHGKAK